MGVLRFSVDGFRVLRQSKDLGLQDRSPKPLSPKAISVELITKILLAIPIMLYSKSLKDSKPTAQNPKPKI